MSESRVKYKLAIIEDRPQLLKLLEAYFSISAYFDLVLTAVSYEEFEKAWTDQIVNIILCDLELPGKSGIEATWLIKKRRPSVEVVIYTVLEHREAVFQALCAGASGYLVKGKPVDEIEERLLEVMRGGAVMSPQIARMIFTHFNPPVAPGKFEIAAQLTPREIEIVNLLRQGHSYKSIGEMLFVSVDTVKYHTRNVYQKLHVTNRTELILKYQ